MGNDSRRPADTAAKVSAGWRDPARHGGERGPLDDDVLASRTEQERVDAGLRPDATGESTGTDPSST
ncbi:hypothetical protein [Parafrankia elaeagni]|uniref:hypothetical protein n=1 Tax=Parafrankia elaeagni TaxID=222534 RepID=UPI00036B2199|nr:hypothetical protein [Parafrankia elaeagni]